MHGLQLRQVKKLNYELGNNRESGQTVADDYSACKDHARRTVSRSNSDVAHTIFIDSCSAFVATCHLFDKTLLGLRTFSSRDKL